MADKLAYRSRRSRKHPRHWRENPDILFPPLESAEPATSLCPGPSIIHRYCDRDPVAIAIVAAWEPSIGFARLIHAEAA